MASEGLAGPVAASSPYLWLGAAALLAGAALGQAALALSGRARAGRASEARPRTAGRWSRATAALALAILAGAGALILPPKAALGDALLPPWCAALAACGLAAGLRPRAAGLPLLGLAIAARLALGAALAGWLPYGGPSPIARLLPFEAEAATLPGPAGGRAGAGRFVGELSTEPVGGGFASRRIDYEAAGVSLVVETLELSGPAGFAASAVKAAPPTGAGRVSRYYRVVALAGGTRPLPLATPSASFLGLARLGAEEGFAGGTAATASWPGGLVRLSRGASAALPVESLVAIEFGLGEGPLPAAAAR